MSKLIFLAGCITVTLIFSQINSVLSDKLPTKYNRLSMPNGGIASEDTGFMQNIQKLDDQECIPRLLCEMAVSAKKIPLSKEESSILQVFNNEKIVAEKNGKSPMSIYKFAIEIGNNSGSGDQKSQTSDDPVRCQKHFSKCPLTGRDLMSAFKSIIVSKI